MKSDEPKYPEKIDSFGDIFKSVHHFLHERPVRGILQSIDDFFRQPFPYSPLHVIVRETDSNHVVTAELPGVKKDQILIDILGNTLTISIKKQEIVTEQDDKNNLFRHSESLQHASRTITFPHTIDEKDVNASYRDGLLKVYIPKLQGKQIDILE